LTAHGYVSNILKAVVVRPPLGWLDDGNRADTVSSRVGRDRLQTLLRSCPP
jgi:hypothetical protein